MSKVHDDRQSRSVTLTQADFNECLQKMIDGHYMVMQALHKFQTKLSETSFLLEGLQASGPLAPSEEGNSKKGAC